MKKKGKAVLVTTVHRGVFFGYLESGYKDTAKIVALTDCKNAIYWSGKNGFLGLAADGPESGSRIGSRAARVVLQDVTSITDVSEKAVAVWEK